MTSQEIKKIQTQAQAQLSQIDSLAGLEAWEIQYLGRKQGKLTAVLKSLAGLEPAERKAVGAAANEVRSALEQASRAKRAELKKEAEILKLKELDSTLPVVLPEIGQLHPVTKVQRELEDIFLKLGLITVEGPELETDYYNFESLNIPKGHPARDMWDTFYVKAPGLSGTPDGQYVLRTHTSPMQVRLMEKIKPPFAVIVPGRVYRNESTDARHEHTLHQLEGLVVGENISVANLKHVLQAAMSEFFGANLKTQFRPSYFPFVEPGFEVAVECPFGDQEGCSVCGGTGWVELLGAGMVHPKVFESAGYPMGKYTGFAFGLGIDRFAMIKYNIPDVRIFAENDYNFLQQK